MTNETKRDHRGRWRPGASGHPAGRPKGVGKVHRLRAMIDESAPDILAALIELARRGDVQAARVLLERGSLPATRAVDLPQPVQLEGAALVDKANAVLAALARGELSVTQATGMVAALADVARLTELTEIEARIRALEEQERQRGDH